MNKIFRKEFPLWKILTYGCLLLGLAFMVLPFFYMLTTSVKLRAEAMKVPIVWIPSDPQWENYVKIFQKYKFLNYYRNTALVTIAEVGIQFFTCTMAAYVFARLNFPYKNVIFMACMTVMMVPSHMMMIPRFIMVKSVGLMDSLWGIIIPNLPSIYSVFFMRQHFASLPRELDESAKLDGAGHLRIYFQILMPLVRNGLIAFLVLQILWAWNDMLWPMVIVQRQKNYMLSIAVSVMQGQYGNEIPMMMTAGVVAMFPMLIVFLLGQKSFLEGIALSGLKN